MSKDPTLAMRETTNRRIYAKGGLHYLKGNSAPYFSLTGETYIKTGNGRWRDDSCGSIHDELHKFFPQLDDLAALHLSDIDGVPMHALENGFYHLGGTHWQTPNFKHAAEHFRITEDEALALTRDLFGPGFSENGGFLSKGYANEAKLRLGAWIDTQLPRWKAEADACIAKHGLVVYGDEWRS
jgi:hypothetical protein